MKMKWIVCTTTLVALLGFGSVFAAAEGNPAGYAVLSNRTALPIAAPANRISADTAKEAAAKDAGCDIEKLFFTQAKLEKEDGIFVYELEFFSEDTEYDYEIDAVTGTVVKRSTEVLKLPASFTGGNTAELPASHSGTATPPAGTAAETTIGTSCQISTDSAKTIALEHAGLKAGNVRFTKAELDWDDGRYEYEIEFYNGAMEYEYTICATTGAILEFDSEYDD